MKLSFYPKIFICSYCSIFKILIFILVLCISVFFFSSHLVSVTLQKDDMISSQEKLNLEAFVYPKITKQISSFITYDIVVLTSVKEKEFNHALKTNQIGIKAPIKVSQVSNKIIKIVKIFIAVIVCFIVDVCLAFLFVGYLKEKVKIYY